MDLTPSPLIRLAHACLGAGAVPFGVGLWAGGFDPEPVARCFAVALLGVGAFIAVLSLRIGVERRDGVVRVRGLLRTRVVPRTSIEEVTGFPALRWRDNEGRRRWTPIVFSGDSPGALSHFERHNAAQLDGLRKGITLPRP